MGYELTIDRRTCFAPGCNKPAEQWHHVLPRCVTKQRPTDLRGAVPLCRDHHALATAESTLIKAGNVCWEATSRGKQHIDNLIADYLAGKTCPELGAKYGLNRTTVYDVLKRCGVPLRRRGYLRKGQFSWSSQAANTWRSEYEAGTSLNQLSQKYKRAIATIAAAIRHDGGVIRTHSEAMVRCGEGMFAFDSQTAKALRAEYEAGMTTPQLSRRYKCSPDSIASAIRRAGGTLRTGSEATCNSRHFAFDLCVSCKVRAEYEAGVSVPQLCRRYNRAEGTIRRTIERAGGTLRTRSESARLRWNSRSNKQT